MDDERGVDPPAPSPCSRPRSLSIIARMGIPPAPSSSDTLGLRLRAIIPGGPREPRDDAAARRAAGLSFSPTGKDFGTNYQLSFDAWSNFCGAPNAAGLADNGASEGGTYNVMFAVGTSGTVPLVVGNTALATHGAMDGVGFATTGDGGITNDYRVYPAVRHVGAGGHGRSLRGGFDGEHERVLYDSVSRGELAPAVQQSISTNEYGGDAANMQAGSTQAGAFGFAWHKVVITKLDNIVTWEVDEEPIATFDASALALGGNNIGIGLSDVNTTTARHPSLVFTVFDNLVVTDNSSGQPGDFTGNGIVDAMDLQQWQGDFGLNDESDADGDDDSDGADFLIWQQNLGAPGQTAAAAAVPEPAASLLALSVISPRSRCDAAVVNFLRPYCRRIRRRHNVPPGCPGVRVRATLARHGTQRVFVRRRWQCTSPCFAAFLGWARRGRCILDGKMSAWAGVTETTRPIADHIGASRFILALHSSACVMD